MDRRALVTFSFLSHHSPSPAFVFAAPGYAFGRNRHGHRWRLDEMAMAPPTIDVCTDRTVGCFFCSGYPPH